MAAEFSPGKFRFQPNGAGLVARRLTAARNHKLPEQSRESGLVPRAGGFDAALRFKPHRRARCKSNCREMLMKIESGEML